jgi:hypothetical protein
MVCKIKGLMVACCTLSSILMTTSPVRWIISKTGGFSLRALRVRRQGAAPTHTLQAAVTGFPSGFGDLVRLAFVACNKVNLVAFDHARQGCPLFFYRCPCASVLSYTASRPCSSPVPGQFAGWTGSAPYPHGALVKYRHSTQTDLCPRGYNGW